MRSICFTLGMLFCASAFAGVDIQKAIDEAEYEVALKEIESRLKKTDVGEADLVDLYWWQGYCLVSLENIDQARDAFNDLLRVHPAYRPARNISPKVRAVFDAALNDYQNEQKKPLESVNDPKNLGDPPLDEGSIEEESDMTLVWVGVGIAAAVLVAGAITAGVLLGTPVETRKVTVLVDGGGS